MSAMQKLIVALVVANLLIAVYAESNGKCDESEGNHYCKQVSKIHYQNIDQPGRYMRTTGMDSETGVCSKQSLEYSGAGSPLDQEVSIHFRGPLELIQFAAYTRDTSSSNKAHHKHRRHTEDQRRLNDDHHEKRSSPDMVTVVIDGQTVLWPNDYVSTAAMCIVPPGSSQVDVNVTKSSAVVATANTAITTAAATTNTTAAQSSSAAASSDKEAWGRVAYYNSADNDGTDGLVFLNNRGDPKLSGTWDGTFGNSVSYASSDGKKAAASSTSFEGGLATSDDEIFIMTDTKCDGDDCGFYREGSVAYHGFDGAHKAFVFEFSMPHTDKGDHPLKDAPAIWILNANIPRVGQYARNGAGGGCSCWDTGCGELDVYEVLSTGETRCKTAFHRKGNSQGGNPNYFKRPVDGTIKFAVIMSGSDFYLVTLPNSIDFPESLDASDVQAMLDGHHNEHVSVVKIGD